MINILIVGVISGLFVGAMYYFLKGLWKIYKDLLKNMMDND